MESKNCESGASAMENGRQDAETIRSVYLTGHGGYDKIVVKTVPRPTVQKEHVLVRVKACGLNFSDLLSRQGIYSFYGIKPPFIMGLECSGVVEEVAPDVQNVKVGERVMCWSFRWGMWSELAHVPQLNCLPIPENMTYEEAAAIPVQYLTAHLALLDFGNLKPGQNVLLQAAAGGVGWAATQIAKTIPNVTIFGTASASKHDLIRDNGVHHAIDYRSKDFINEIKNISPQGVDVVLDCLGGQDLIRAQGVLKQMGKVVAIGVSNMISGEKRNLLQNLKVWWQMKNISYLQLINENQATCGINVSTLMEKDPQRFRNGLSDLIKLFVEGKIKPRIDSTFSFDQVIEATKRIVERKNIGKVILVPSKVE